MEQEESTQGPSEVGERLQPVPVVLENKDSVERLLNSENLKNILKELFSKATIIDTEVKRGSKSSSNIYVKKALTGKRATVIIWDE